uniref:Uncharacterized protein n=1 Tax=Rhizophora mucronata TaxID=61149 RepID=A0A2P2QQ91_RHIMU
MSYQLKGLGSISWIYSEIWHWCKRADILIGSNDYACEMGEESVGGIDFVRHYLHLGLVLLQFLVGSL